MKIFCINIVSSVQKKVKKNGVKNLVFILDKIIKVRTECDGSKEKNDKTTQG